MVELVDTLDLGSSAARRKSSSLFIRTKYSVTLAMGWVGAQQRRRLASLSRNMVGVAQLVEHGIVTPVVEGSIPFVHPIFERRQI